MTAVAAPLRMRVISWPSPCDAPAKQIYGVKVIGLADPERQALVAAAGREGLAVRRGPDAVVLCGSPGAFASLAAHTEVPAAAKAAAVLNLFRTPARMVECRGHRLDLGPRPLIVGILNATSDSFYDRGRYFDLPVALDRADAMVGEGADLIEVGGETARPGPALSVEEESRRVVPLLEVLRTRVSIPLALDTYKPEVARRGLAAGVVLLNDISGLADLRMAEIAAETGAALVAMHIQGRPKVRQIDPRYRSVIDDVYAFLEDRTAAALAIGLPRSQLLVDPGFSFGKTAAHDIEVLRCLATFRGLGYPIYLATSRKNYIRDLLGLPFEELLEGTAAAIAYGIAQGARLVRTHDVRFMSRLAKMMEAIVPFNGGSAGPPGLPDASPELPTPSPRQ
jgi:dihydropteroate synthase